MVLRSPCSPWAAWHEWGTLAVHQLRSHFPSRTTAGVCRFSVKISQIYMLGWMLFPVFASSQWIPLGMQLSCLRPNSESRRSAQGRSTTDKGGPGVSRDQALEVVITRFFTCYEALNRYISHHVHTDGHKCLQGCPLPKDVHARGSQGDVGPCQRPSRPLQQIGYHGEILGRMLPVHTRALLLPSAR